MPSLLVGPDPPWPAWPAGATRRIVLALGAIAFAKGKKPFLDWRDLSYWLNNAVTLPGDAPRTVEQRHTQDPVPSQRWGQQLPGEKPVV